MRYLTIIGTIAVTFFAELVVAQNPHGSDAHHGGKLEFVRVNSGVELNIVDETEIKRKEAIAEKPKKKLGGLEPDFQREAMRYLRMLKSPDRDVRLSGRTNLKKMAKDHNIVGFLVEIIPGLHGNQVGEALYLLKELSPKNARKIAENFVTSARATQRAAALALFASLGSSKNSELIARGMVDQDIVVRVTAANGLGVLRVKEATPLLIEGMRSSNQKLKFESTASLCWVWEIPLGTEGTNSVDFWQKHWEENKKHLSRSLYSKDLAPLSDESEDDGDLVSL